MHLDVAALQGLTSSTANQTWFELQQMASLMKAMPTRGNILRIKCGEETGVLNEHCQSMGLMATRICENILRRKNTFNIQQHSPICKEIIKFLRELYVEYRYKNAVYFRKSILDTIMFY